MIDDAKRVDPPVMAPERAMLDAWLDYQRATLAGKCAGLSTQQLRERAVPPSSLSLLGLVRHMTEVERGWFSRTLAGRTAGPVYNSEADPRADFDDIERQSADEALAAWQLECQTSRDCAAAASSLDDIGKHRRRPEDEQPSLRWIMIHMIEEYARHNGHADLLRERIDGSTGD